jgi:phospholipase D1/2
MGGFDICYGRYDTFGHLIFEYDNNFYPGIEYNNQRIKDITNVRKYKKRHIPKEVPRLPWHDVGLKARGRVVWDLCKHFIQSWNHANY